MLPTLLLIVACTALLAGFLGVLHAGWFSGMEHGFLATMVLAIAGFAIMATAVSGMFSYRAGQQIVHQEIVAGLGNAGDIVEATLRDKLLSEVERLNEYARLLSAGTAAGNAQQLDAVLRPMDELNKQILQIRVFDAQTKLLASSHVQGGAEKTDLVAVANALEGRQFISDAYPSETFQAFVLAIAVPIPGAGKEPVGALAIRYDLQTELSGLINATRFGGNGYAVIVDRSGHVLAHPEKGRINEDFSANPAFQEVRQGRRGWVVAPNAEGRQQLFVYRPLASPASGNPPPWGLLLEADEETALESTRVLRNQILVAIAILAIAGVPVGRRVALSISAPVLKLGQFVGKVEGGDFTGSVAESRDEIGRLAAALNRMVRALEERDRVKELFGRYVATQVSEKLVKGEVNLEGESRRVTILFSDIRNFTTMSEQMTPAQVVAFLNDYFSEMVEAVFAQGGVLDKFMGDGLMAVFGSMEETPDHPRRAVMAALRMKALLSKINGDRGVLGKPPIGIGIGIHTDEVIVGNIGSRRRLEYTVVGDGVNTCSRVEALNKEFGTTILITQPTYEAVKDEFECRLMPEKELRGKTRALAFYEVVSMKGPPSP